MSNRITASILALLACLLAAGTVAAFEPPKPITPRLTLRYQKQGEKEDVLVREAMVQAVRAGVGRIYFSNVMLRGLDVLDPYIRQHVQTFIPRHEVLVSEVRGGQRYVDVEIVVDMEKLYQDLFEKQFLYRPALRPVYYAALSETLNGEPVASQFGRTYLIRKLNDLPERRFRFLWTDEVDDPAVPVTKKQAVTVENVPANADVSAKLDEACREMQRHEVEFFLTGAIQTSTTRSVELYLNTVPTHFVETHARIQMVRSDTGQVIRSVDIRKVSGNVDLNKAMEDSVASAMDVAATQLFDDFAGMWGKTVQDKADVRILVAGATADNLNVLNVLLNTLTPKAEIYTRSTFDGVAVLNLGWSGPMEKLVNLLREARHPEFKVTQVGTNGLLIELL
jgi:hypothetical protein